MLGYILSQLVSALTKLLPSNVYVNIEGKYVDIDWSCIYESSTYFVSFLSIYNTALHSYKLVISIYLLCML